jgi:hypothetical protein
MRGFFLPTSEPKYFAKNPVSSCCLGIQAKIPKYPYYFCDADATRRLPFEEAICVGAIECIIKLRYNLTHRLFDMEEISQFKIFIGRLAIDRIDRLVA